MQKLILAEDVFDALYEGKLTTIRKGRRDIQLGDLLFESIDNKREMVVSVNGVNHCRLAGVHIDDLQLDGFHDHDDMLGSMKRFYPDITFDSEVTVIKFTHKPSNVLNRDDYEIYEEYLEEQMDIDDDDDFEGYSNYKVTIEEETEQNDDFDKSKYLLKAKRVSIIDSEGELLGNFENETIYNFYGSSLFVVNEENETAFYCVEPREYNSIEAALLDSDAPMYNLVSEMEGFNPDVIILCE